MDKGTNDKKYGQIKTGGYVVLQQKLEIISFFANTGVISLKVIKLSYQYCSVSSSVLFGLEKCCKWSWVSILKIHLVYPILYYWNFLKAFGVAGAKYNINLLFLYTLFLVYWNFLVQTKLDNNLPHLNSLFFLVLNIRLG